ncbi:DUF1311 domain-containing protein [Paraburkholderia sp. JPY432]|uniref:lysozyme inhibitor LprI family protein n=1 Tax=Paraburkholderia TaxID=1822464 RepID=UPI0015962864|nr:lysozyme inhibitor LprI family protein [Paraburkholderia youngii]NVH75624.1 DUF1311 domain-containing protein [Paraburkholderia youngii]
MKRNLLVVALVVFMPEISMAYTACTGGVTFDLEACAKINFEESDKYLNSNYKSLFATLSEGDRDVLVKAQRKWVSYKESTCQGAYDATFPGEEAGIDKWSCLDQITRARKRELEYLKSGIGGDEFFRAADIVSKFYEHGKRENFISKLVNEFSKDSDSKWREYVSNNCALAISRVHDQKDQCVARQEFYKY